MATEKTPKQTEVREPANRVYVFAKNCTNDHGTFVIGDKARGAFSAELVASYVAAGILVEAQRG
jgi:L-fucose isomerase-like protein